MNPPAPWTQWQLIDSAFPAGAFGHSSGLEAAVQMGLVAGVDELRRFVETSLQQSAAFGTPYVLGARAQPDRLLELDQSYDVLLVNDVANRASRAQGRALVMTASGVWPVPGLVSLRQVLRGGSVCGHLAPCFGHLAGTLAFDPRQTAEMFLFIQARGILSAAVRLSVLGTVEAQHLQAGLGEVLHEAVELALATPLEDAAQVAPVLDLLQAQHDRLYSRLFLS